MLPIPAMWDQIKVWVPYDAIHEDEKLPLDLAGPGYRINRSNLLVLDSKASPRTTATGWR